MSVFVTGDIHGDPTRLNTTSFYEQKEFKNKEENIVIILGDFGLVWNRGEENKNEKYWLEWLNNKPFTTVFVDGNHENHVRLAEYPVREWNGGRVHKIRSHVLHLMRGEIFQIEGKKVFAFGGACSHDIKDGILNYEDLEWRKKAKELDELGKYMYRVKNLNWWQEELPNKEEMQNGWNHLKKNQYQIDYILSHSPSTLDLQLMTMDKLYDPDILTDYLDEIKAAIKYKKHLFGHMHVSKQINDKDVCLYEQIIQI